MTKRRLLLIHWKPDEATARVSRLRDAGYSIDASPVDRDSLKVLRRDPPSAVVIDLSQTVVRKLGLDSGLVDHKVCSIDATWYGLLFAKRKPARA